MIKNKKNRISKLIVAMCLGFLAFSCNTLRNRTIIGEYVFRDDVKRLTLTLKSNNEFEYKQEMSLNYSTSLGKWEQLNNEIVLKSYDSYKTDFFEVIESYSENEKYIQIFDDQGLGIYGAEVAINDDQIREITDEDGKIYYKDDSVSSIHLYWIGISEGFYRVKNTDSNVFILKAVEIDYAKSYFNNEKAHLKKNAINFNNRKFVKLSN